MAALGAQTIASSYEQLLHTDTDGGGNGNTLVTIKDGDNGTTFGIKLATNKVEIIPGSNDANAFEVSQADGTAVFTVNTSSPAFTLTGDATLGNSSSSALVTIKTTGSSNHAGLSLEAPASGTGDPYINFKQGSGDGSANNMNYQLVHDTSEGYFKFRSADSDGSSTDADIWRVVDGTDDFRIPTGRIAIGDVAPTAPLHIKAAPINTSGARSAQLYVEDTTAFGSVQNSGIQFRQEWQSGSTTSTSAIVGTRTSTSSGNYGGALIFQTRENGGDLADNMIIDDDGKIGIGTTSPSIGLLDVRHTGASTSVDTATVLNLKQEASSTTANLRFNTATNNSAGHIMFSTDGSFQIRTDGNNLTTFPNNGGVALNSETGAANTLDDYEEGTWTAALDNTAESIENATGHYVKIGSQVTCTWYSGGIDSINVGSGDVTITGLPFTSKSTANSHSSMVNIAYNTVGPTAVTGFVNTGATTFTFTQQGVTTKATYAVSSGAMMVSCVYFTH